MMIKDLHTEKDLLLQLSKGNEFAFQEIYNCYYSKIASFAYLLTESSYLTEEIVQEVFMKLWINRRKLSDVNNFNAWLHTITKNLVADSMKKIAREIQTKKKVIKFAIEPKSNDTQDFIAFREKKMLLEQAIEQLSPQQQLVYKLSHEQGLRNKEIALKLHISNKTVKNHLTNGLRIIRRYFLLSMGEKNS